MILNKIFQASTSTLKSPSSELVDALTGGSTTATGKSVTPDQSLRVSSVYSCVRILSETIAALPLNLYERTDDNGNRKIARNNALNRCLHVMPNSEMTAMDFRMYQMVSLLLRGTTFSEAYRARSGEMGEIIPLNPDYILVDRVKKTGKLAFEDHSKGQRTIPNHRMWRICGMSLNGITGLSPISCAREGIAISMSLEEHGARRLCSVF